MDVRCELCHKKKAIGTKWVNADESPIFVGGIYRVCEDCGGKKSCTKCKAEKPLDQFAKGSIIGTRLSQCKQCGKQRYAEYQKINREKLNEYQRLHRKKRGGYGVKFGEM